MYTLRKHYRFEASHKLEHHDGKCARLHGHSWTVVVEVKGMNLHESGAKENMLCDFGDISAIVKPIIDRLDHRHLNDVFNIDMPTSEWIAKHLYIMIKRHLPELSAVEIGETCTSECRYEDQ